MALLALVIATCVVSRAADAATFPFTPAPWTEAIAEPAKHATPGATCGISSGNFARTCRAGTYQRCMNAVARGVEGFTGKRCARERDTCSRCLKHLHTCIGRIGHVVGRVTKSTCESCQSRFNVCMGGQRI